MSARIVLGLLAMSTGLALAQPAIPPGDMAGRERFRFIESPAERYMRPGPYVEEPLVSVQPHKHRPRKHGRRKHR